MTGQHTGHTRIRGNHGQTGISRVPLKAEDVTVAEVEGTYLNPGGGMMASQGKKPGYRLLGAIVEAHLRLRAVPAADRTVAWTGSERDDPGEALSRTSAAPAHRY